MGQQARPHEQLGTVCVNCVVNSTWTDNHCLFLQKREGRVACG